MSQASRLHGALFAALAFCALPEAVRAQLGTELGVGRTDNIDRLESGGRSEEMVTASVGGLLTNEGAVSEAALRWELGGVHYRDDTYEDEALAFLDGNARFDLHDQRIFWNFNDQLGRLSVDPFAPTTPDLREYANFFSTGPDFIVPLGDTVALDAGLSYSDVWYEEQTVGNSRNGARLGVVFSPRPIQSFGLHAAVSRLSFDEEELYDDYDRRQVYFQYETRRRRGEFEASIGKSDIRGLEGSRDGVMLEGIWTRSVSASSDFALEFRRGLSDAGELFQFGQIGGTGLGAVENVPVVATPIEHSYVSARFGVDRPRTGGSISLAWSRQEHHESIQQLNDRDLPIWSAEFRREMTPRVRFDIAAIYTTEDFANLDRRDSERHVRLGFGWRLSERAEVALRLARFERSSTEPGMSYEENRVFVTFGYGAEVSAVSSGI